MQQIFIFSKYVFYNSKPDVKIFC